MGLIYKKKVLLGSENRSWSGDSDPANKVRSWEPVMLHAVNRNESPCSPQTRFTVNCNQSFFPFANLQKLLDDVLFPSTLLSMGA